MAGKGDLNSAGQVLGRLTAKLVSGLPSQAFRIAAPIENNQTDTTWFTGSGCSRCDGPYAKMAKSLEPEPNNVFAHAGWKRGSGTPITALQHHHFSAAGYSWPFERLEGATS
jgi:hypothetical protein